MFVINQGLFCYKVMSFGLKNAGAPYQRLMNKMFIHQIGTNVQVYVDDMLVKSIREDDCLDDLKEIFDTLHSYNVKLKNVKEVQSLNKKIAALNRFVSRATDKCLPFFRTLEKSFEWTVECQQAFDNLKAYLSSLPLLSPSKPSEEFFLYLAVSPAAVNAALIREKGGV